MTVFRFDDEGVSTRSDLGASEIKWKLVKKAWAFPEVWLLFVTNNQYITLPTKDLGSEAEQFIRQKIEESGGRVT